MTSGASDGPLVEVQGLGKSFAARSGLLARLLRRGGTIRALDGVNLSIRRGETLGLIGESGCGKSTLARVLLRLQEPSAGTIRFDGEDITAADRNRLRQLRRRMQIVFQDPYAALNPRQTVEQIVGLPLRIAQRLGREAARPHVAAMIERVGLKRTHLNRFPHQFSGGQRQRIGIARALVARPDFVICDEAVSALDVSIQAQILGLLQELRRDLGLTYLFISHNLAVVGHVSDRIAVMYLGEVVELAPARAVLAAPRHPYTQSLLAAVPRLAARDAAIRPKLAGEPPSPIAPPPGCRFHPRCAKAVDSCRTTRPTLRDISLDHAVACHLADNP
ncbi:MAG: ATP-binding cassette domain-containing protein [Alphaproteobacteria bacterium]|nr:ATP-binding cassette domain-containing protein [Alphaproteobacteria bacterium]